VYLLQVDFDRSGRPILLSHEHHVADAFEFNIYRSGQG
jgi:DNA-binding GntR family transcriptional regulator